MDYEYGILFGMEEYEPMGTRYTMQDAMAECEGASGWRFVRGRWVADTDDPNEFWYVREVD